MNIIDFYFKELRQNNNLMTELEFYLAKEYKNLKLKKTDVANKLEITLPTLTAKTNNPLKLTIENLQALKNIGINIQPILKSAKLL